MIHRVGSGGRQALLPSDIGRKEEARRRRRADRVPDGGDWAGPEGERTKQHRRSALQSLLEGLEAVFADGKAEMNAELDLYYRVRWACMAPLVFRGAVCVCVCVCVRWAGSLSVCLRPMAGRDETNVCVGGRSMCRRRKAPWSSTKPARQVRIPINSLTHSHTDRTTTVTKERVCICV
jgi:hypothetical protein